MLADRILCRQRRWSVKLIRVYTIVCIALVIIGLTVLDHGSNFGFTQHFYTHCSHMTTYNKNRTQLYDKMAADFRANGAAFLTGGETSQSLKITDIFSFKDGKIAPVLKPATPPVRAAVLRLPQNYADLITQSIKETFGSRISSIWYQNPQVYHFSLFHASHHLEPVSASETEIEAEVKAVEEVAKTCCPLHIQLDRVVLTSTGVLIGCWQVLDGTDPFVIRSKLESRLPNAPQKQIYDRFILHTSFARILPPNGNDASKGENKITSTVLEELVLDLNSRLHNFEAKVAELWYVEELDVLALALDGRMKVHKFPLGV